MVVLETVLLAGPAFAVGLRRRRRELAGSRPRAARPGTCGRSCWPTGWCSAARRRCSPPYSAPGARWRSCRCSSTCWAPPARRTCPGDSYWRGGARPRGSASSALMPRRPRRPPGPGPHPHRPRGQHGRPAFSARPRRTPGGVFFARRLLPRQPGSRPGFRARRLLPCQSGFHGRGSSWRTPGVVFRASPVAGGGGRAGCPVAGGRLALTGYALGGGKLLGVGSDRFFCRRGCWWCWGWSGSSRAS